MHVIPPKVDVISPKVTSWTFRIFFLFLVRGVGRGGGRFLLEIPGEGGGVLQEGEGLGPGGYLQRIGEFGGAGGLNFFFSGPKRPPR